MDLLEANYPFKSFKYIILRYVSFEQKTFIQTLTLSVNGQTQIKIVSTCLISFYTVFKCILFIKLIPYCTLAITIWLEFMFRFMCTCSWNTHIIVCFTLKPLSLVNSEPKVWEWIYSVFCKQFDEVGTIVNILLDICIFTSISYLIRIIKS